MSGLAELRELLAKATPGPWKKNLTDINSTANGWGVATLIGEGAIGDRDAALIVGLRNRADALLDIAEAASEMQKRIKPALGGGYMVRPNSEEIVEGFQDALARLEADS